MTNATTAPDAIAQRARHCLQDSPGCRVHGLQYRDALDAQAVARREQREFALQQWRRTASQMLKEIRPRREIASGKGGARTPNPGIMRPFSCSARPRSAKAASSAAIRRTLPGRAQWLRTQPRTAFGLARLERCLRLREYLQVPTTLRHVQTPSDRADATRRVMTFASTENGAQMRKNYHQVRKQRELARKVRQQEKQQRRSARVSAAAATPAVATPEGDSVAMPEPTLRGAS